MNIKKIIQTLSLAMIGLVVGSSVKYTLDDYGIASNNWNKLLIAKITIDTNPGGGTPGGTPGGTEEEDTGTEDEGESCDPDTGTKNASGYWQLDAETITKERGVSEITYAGETLKVDSKATSIRIEFQKPVCRSENNSCCSKEHTEKGPKNPRVI